MRACVLFSGLGGTCLGAQQAGFETIGYELNEWAVSRANEAGCASIQADLTKMCPSDRVDVVFASPPCIGFSRCSQRADWHADACNLTVRTAEIIKEMAPPAFALENVTDILKSTQFASFIEILSTDYHMLSFMVDASRVGCCQNRRRVFCLGVRHGDGVKDALLALVPSIQTTMQTAQRTTLGDVIPELGERKLWLYPRHSNDVSLFSSNECVPTLRRMAVFKPSPCVRGPACYQVGIDPSNPAPVVPDPEICARLSGFPSGYFTIRPREVTKWGLGLGNVVPPPLQKYIATLLAQVYTLAGTGGEGSYYHAKYTLRRRLSCASEKAGQT